MNRLTATLTLALGFVLSACSTPPAEQPAPAAAPPPAPARLTAGWSVTERVDAPESAHFDKGSNSIFVSIIGGQPNEKDGNGRIMKLSPDGKVENAAWFTKLNAPKGLRSHDGMLWVADIDEVVGIDIATGGAMALVKIEGAQFLNDVAVGDEGTVYVSDMLASKIYAIKDGKPSVLVQGAQIEYPNGLLVEGDRLIVGGWGKPEADFTTKVPGRLFAIDLKTKAKTLITQKPFANIDGLESDGSGGYIITDWVKGALMQVSSAGDVKMLKQFMPGTADLAYDAASRIAIIPHMMENKIASYDLTDVLK